MATSAGSDPIDAMQRFLDNIARYDQRPGVAVMSVELRVGRSRDTFELNARATQAFAEALARYVDPDDCGRCANCGGPLNKDLYCINCGHLDGIFGQTLAHFVTRGDAD